MRCLACAWRDVQHSSCGCSVHIPSCRKWGFGLAAFAQNRCSRSLHPHCLLRVSCWMTWECLLLLPLRGLRLDARHSSILSHAWFEGSQSQWTLVATQVGCLQTSWTLWSVQTRYEHSVLSCHLHKNIWWHLRSRLWTSFGYRLWRLSLLDRSLTRDRVKLTSFQWGFGGIPRKMSESLLLLACYEKVLIILTFK